MVMQYHKSRVIRFMRIFEFHKDVYLTLFVKENKKKMKNGRHSNQAIIVLAVLESRADC